MSKIAPISAPANLKHAGPEKKLYPNFGTVFESNHVMFGKVTPTRRKVHLDALNWAPIFDFLYLTTFFSEPFNFLT